jgi:hypothetical protein
METQTQSNAKVTIPANGRVIVDADQYEDSMTDLDDFDLAKIFKPHIDMGLSPVPAPEMVELIDGLLAKGNSFRSMNDQYEQKYIIQGNEELYELLAGIYGFMLSVNESPYRDHILKRMRDWLNEEKSIVLQEATAIESVVVRYIVPADRQTAFNYARVLKVAFQEKIVAKDLAGYIKGRGGITKIQDTLENEKAAKEKKEVAKKKVSLYKKVLLARTKGPGADITVPTKVFADFVGKAKDQCLFDIALLTRKGDGQWRVNQIVNVPEAVGEPILNYVSNNIIPDDKVEEAQDKLDALRAKLGIKYGYGMIPGDKGYELYGMVPKQPAEKEVSGDTQTAE